MCSHLINYTYKSIFFKNIEYMSQQYTAIIVEPREHKALVFVLNNFCTNLDENWNIIVLWKPKRTFY